MNACPVSLIMYYGLGTLHFIRVNHLQEMFDFDNIRDTDILQFCALKVGEMYEFSQVEC